MRRLRITSLLCLLLIVSGCASVYIVDKDGKPVPTHVISGNIPPMGMQVDFALIRYYGQKEGDEYLDTHEYLNPYASSTTVKTENLRSITIMLHIRNPRKESYRLITNYYCPESKQNVIYNGNLSRKEFFITLPTNDGMEYAMRFELQTQGGFVFFESPKIRYEVEKSAPVTRESHFMSSK